MATSVTLTAWTDEVVVYNTSDSDVTVTATNMNDVTNVVTVPAGRSAFVGVAGQRPDVLNVPGSGGSPFATNATVQTLTGAEITVALSGDSAGALSVQSDNSVLVSAAAS